VEAGSAFAAYITGNVVSNLIARLMSAAVADHFGLVSVSCTTGSDKVVGSHLLLAVGRRPNIDELGLDQVRVAVDARGFIQVDDQLRTNVPGIWALGDCNGRGVFTYTSYNDF
jgi:pyruvate/2-oxoglutarate dehydrogenase complex dihydrolipoamide dehydrogenase (E3) component